MADHDQRQRSHRGDAGGIERVLVRIAGGNAEHRAHAVAGQLGYGQRSGLRRVVDDVQAGLVPQTINVVVVAQHAVPIHIQHDVIPDAQIGPGVPVEVVRPGHEERVFLDGAATEGHRQRTAGHVSQRGIRRPLPGRHGADDVYVRGKADNTWKACRVNTHLDRRVFIERLDVFEERILSQRVAGELSLALQRWKLGRRRGGAQHQCEAHRQGAHAKRTINTVGDGAVGG